MLRLQGSPHAGASCPSRAPELVELTHLARVVASAVAPASRGDTVRESFLSGVRREFDAYLSALAALDAELSADVAAESRAPPAVAPPLRAGLLLQLARGAPIDVPSDAHTGGGGGVDGAAGAPQSWLLRRLAGWSSERVVVLRALASLLAAVDGLHGGAICAVLYAHTACGDDRVRRVVARVFAAARAPLIAAARQWVLLGALPAAGGGQRLDFFVEDAPAADVDTDGPWLAGARLVDAKRPAFIPRHLAESIVRTGKVVNFLCAANGDGEWVRSVLEPIALEAEAKEVVRMAGPAAVGVRGGGSGGGVGAGASVSAAAVGEDGALLLLGAVVHALTPHVNLRLMQQLLGRHRALAHLQVVHRYILLTQGDFVSVLLGGMSAELAKPASALVLSAHVLSGVLESAVRGSNAGLEDRALVDRIFVTLAPSGGGGNGGNVAGGGVGAVPVGAKAAASPAALGWDIFRLGYAVDPPVNAIITPRAQDAYARLFVFLWRVRRAEDALSALWNTGKAASAGIEWLGHERLARLLHAAALARMLMGHFLSCLSSYLMLGVLAPAWARLEEAVGDAADLDAVLAAHAAYLRGLEERVLFSYLDVEENASAADGVGGGVGGGTETTRIALGAARVAMDEALDLVLRFTSEVSRTLAAAEPLAVEAKGMGIRAGERGGVGHVGSAEAAASAEEARAALSRELDVIVARREPQVRERADAFRAKLESLLAAFDILEEK